MFENYSPYQNNELGRKTFFWYRVYCGVLAALYLLIMAAGIALAVMHQQLDSNDPRETLIMGIVYAAVGAVLFLIFAVALFLPAKPYNWIIGIVMIAIGLTSCCFWPACIPLLIFWLKPETQRFFGRNS